jgi:transposase
MKASDLYCYLLGTDQFLIQSIEFEQEKLGIELKSTTTRAVCPACSQESSSIHSDYQRNPTDLAWAACPVVLHLTVKRFFCQNEDCPKRTFAERFPDFVDVYARRTQRMVKKQQRLSVNLSARVAEKLFRSEQVEVSDTSLNRLLRSLPEPSYPSVRVLGVDDWAKRKGQRYGTILIDLERGQVIDLLEDRTADTLVKWLECHPGIEIVSRDRSQTYAEAITRGAPDALQIADRFHLLKNLSDTVYKLLQQEYAGIHQRLESSVKSEKSPTVDPKLIELPDGLTASEQRRKKRIDQIQMLLQQGWTQKAIAKHLHIHPKTVHRNLNAPSPKLRRHRTGRLLDPFKPYLLQRWNEGCHNATQLFREIRPKGFTGHETLVIDYARLLRQASGIQPKVRNQEGQLIEKDPSNQMPSLRTLAWWIVKKPGERCKEDEALLEELGAGLPKLQMTISLAREFATIIREQQGDQFSGWLSKAQQSGYRVWRNFAAGLQQDEQAVRAALIYSWSNGPTEGNVNRLKCLKRMMYGRANDDLLRKRVLWQGKYAFT